MILGSSIVGTLIGGRLADRYSRLGVLRWGMLAAAGLFALLAAADGVTTGPGGCSSPPGCSSHGFAPSPFIVLGQQYLPGRVGMASGITLGLAVSFGGAAAPLLGLAADYHGIGIIPSLLAVLALVAAALAFLLPRPGAVTHAGEEATPATTIDPVKVEA